MEGVGGVQPVLGGRVLGTFVTNVRVPGGKTVSDVSQGTPNPF